MRIRIAALGASRQRGVSLLVSLVFLVIMAMLGVTVANVTTLQERMAGHTRDRDLALQAAEAALRDAEDRLADPAFRALATVFDPANGNDDSFWQTCFDTNVGPCASASVHTPTNLLPTTGPGAVAEQPEFVVERKPDIGATEIYRVTSRGKGGSDDTVVILQAEFSI